ncbi:hypothetical protein KIW84_051854 [Lathyrus oleraceus]|uniref:DUF7745 domain-containing protein n=1 Tax=Pisum sativum TaxID=3888 RepID=A0A9D5AE56_PEA|nr:hypothetical protein KIW84_051854 [Pisum sativum]
MKAGMAMVPKALIHQICLPSISIHHFDQSKSRGLRFVSQGNPNSSDHQQCLAHEATSAHGQITSRHGKTKKEYKEVQFQTTRLERVKEFDILCTRSLGFQGSFWEASFSSDYSTFPTLEEYAYLVGIPILDQLSFSCLESIPTSQEIADMLHIDESLIDAHMTTKGGIQGLPSEFLIAQATMYGKAMSEDAFEAIFVLIIYGLVLFPNIDKFVDVNAIRIFSTLNLVPTLLGETYFSLLMRNAKGGGAIVCCLPLLYKWFISHLPQTVAFKENKGCLRWSTRLMSYEYPRPTPLVVVGPSTLPDQGVEELRDEDRSIAWIREREELLQQIKEKDALIEFLEHQVIDDPNDTWTSLLPQSSKFWKRKYNRLAKEKADMEAAYEEEVKRLRASYLPVSRALDDCF